MDNDNQQHSNVSPEVSTSTMVGDSAMPPVVGADSRLPESSLVAGQNNNKTVVICIIVCVIAAIACIVVVAIAFLLISNHQNQDADSNHQVSGDQTGINNKVDNESPEKQTESDNVAQVPDLPSFSNIAAAQSRCTDAARFHYSVTTYEDDVNSYTLLCDWNVAVEHPKSLQVAADHDDDITTKYDAHRFTAMTLDNSYITSGEYDNFQNTPEFYGEYRTIGPLCFLDRLSSDEYAEYMTLWSASPAQATDGEYYYIISCEQAPSSSYPLSEWESESRSALQQALINDLYKF